jgi:hypothetical protein
MIECGSLVKPCTHVDMLLMRVPPAQACTRPVQYSFDRSQTPTADPHGWRAAFSQGPASERRRPHAASARARVAVPALAAGLLLVHHEDAYQCVRTCPGARGWGEAWAAGVQSLSRWPRGAKGKHSTSRSFHLHFLRRAAVSRVCIRLHKAQSHSNR